MMLEWRQNLGKGLQEVRVVGRRAPASSVGSLVTNRQSVVDKEEQHKEEEGGAVIHRVQLVSHVPLVIRRTPSKGETVLSDHRLGWVAQLSSAWGSMRGWLCWKRQMDVPDAWTSQGNTKETLAHTRLKTDSPLLAMKK